MRRLKHTIQYELWRSVPLFLCGVFLVYLGAFDETLFYLVASDISNRLLVTAATVLAATLPMFFAVGAIKHSILYGRETIYYYEKLLRNRIFWLSAGVLCIVVAIVAYIQMSSSDFRYFELSGIVTMILSVLAGAYFFYYALVQMGTVQLPSLRGLRRREE
jgi:hypothetical protein